LSIVQKKKFGRQLVQTAAPVQAEQPLRQVSQVRAEVFLKVPAGQLVWQKLSMEFRKYKAAQAVQEVAFKQLVHYIGQVTHVLLTASG
jgi:hypothetical protein